MDRRKFLRNGSLTTMGGIVLGLVAGSWQGIREETPPMAEAPALDLEETTIKELQKKMQSGELTLR